MGQRHLNRKRRVGRPEGREARNRNAAKPRLVWRIRVGRHGTNCAERPHSINRGEKSQRRSCYEIEIPVLPRGIASGSWQPAVRSGAPNASDWERACGERRPNFFRGSVNRKVDGPFECTAAAGANMHGNTTNIAVPCTNATTPVDVSRFPRVRQFGRGDA